jgi:hypothetical protein
VAETYYARRSARDPEWREQQIREAKERESRRREADPEGLRAARREATRRTRERQAARGLTFHELRERCLVRDEETLRFVLRDEIPPRTDRVSLRDAALRHEWGTPGGREARAPGLADR